jgi:hypothetical protein
MKFAYDDHLDALITQERRVKAQKWREQARERKRSERNDVLLVPDQTFPDVPEHMVENRVWKTTLRGRFRDPEHISRLEARAALLAVRRAVKDPSCHGKRRLHLVDNLSFALGAGKGRSSRKCLNAIYRRLLGLTMASGITLKVRWIAGSRMPADGPSRFFGRRAIDEVHLHRLSSGTPVDDDGIPSPPRWALLSGAAYL